MLACATRYVRHAGMAPAWRRAPCAHFCASTEGGGDDAEGAEDADAGLSGAELKQQRALEARKFAQERKAWRAQLSVIRKECAEETRELQRSLAQAEDAERKRRETLRAAKEDAKPAAVAQEVTARMERYRNYSVVAEDAIPLERGRLAQSQRDRTRVAVNDVRAHVQRSDSFLTPSNLLQRIEKGLFFSPRSAILRRKVQVDDKLRKRGRDDAWRGGGREGSVWLFPTAGGGGSTGSDRVVDILNRGGGDGARGGKRR